VKKSPRREIVTTQTPSSRDLASFSSGENSHEPHLPLAQAAERRSRLGVRREEHAYVHRRLTSLPEVDEIMPVVFTKGEK
jgi:hypothetical protein